MPSIFDFSSAIPWLLQGFLAGLLVFWLFRRFFGRIGGNHGQIAALSNELTAAKDRLAVASQNTDSLVNNAKYYEGQYNSLLASNQTLNAGAADSTKLRGELASAKAELQKLRADSVAVAASVEDAYKKQFNSLASELAASKSETEKLRAEAAAGAASLENTYKQQIASLKNDMNSLGVEKNGETTRLSHELAAAKDQIRTLQSQLDATGHNKSHEVSRLESELSAATNEIKTWRDRDLEWRGYEQRYTDDISRLTNEVKAAQATGGEASWLTGEVIRLTSELASLKSSATVQSQSVIDEANAHKAEAARLAKALADAQASHQALAMEHHTTKNDLHQVRSGLEETSLMVAQRHREVEELKAKLASMPADIENYKRFKDALDAANRIASGQS